MWPFVSHVVSVTISGLVTTVNCSPYVTYRAGPVTTPVAKHCVADEGGEAATMPAKPPGGIVKMDTKVVGPGRTKISRVVPLSNASKVSVMPEGTVFVYVKIMGVSDSVVVRVGKGVTFGVENITEVDTLANPVLEVIASALWSCNQSSICKGVLTCRLTSRHIEKPQKHTEEKNAILGRRLNETHSTFWKV